MTEQMRPDIANAWGSVVAKIGRGRDIRKLPTYLTSAERVLDMVGGTIDGKAGLLVATDRRVLFVAESTGSPRSPPDAE